ncbi:beta-ketoacyl-ACP synthase, partial [Escherichia coli]|nr:beta-ketoacyl-ACP synthase [Escherichia coli]
VMNKAMANAGVTPEQIDYVNAHGTGTEANDRIETLAMKKVFANHDKLLVSSTKSYFGHNIGAAGIVELIACLATLPDNRVLPTLNFSQARPNCDLDYVPNEFRDRKVNIFMKNNYAFGGNNCCMILSMEPASIPVSTYDSKRVAISGVGAVSAIGHTLNQVLENIWAQDHHVELGSVTFPD